MVLLLGALAFLWSRAGDVWYWIDEGISIGIASQPIARIPELLTQDGAPPLYYVFLHVWMGLFGTSEATTHVLSLLFALATVPAALWAGWSLFGRRTGWVCAALAALSPYLAYYANETRMRRATSTRSSPSTDPSAETVSRTTGTGDQGAPVESTRRSSVGTQGA